MPVSTWVEVDLDILDQNLDAIGRDIGPEREILLVVKADAYGHGAVEVSRAAAARGVRQFGVATLHEGIQLRRAGLGADVWVLSPLLEREIAPAIEHRLDPTLPSLDFARALSGAARAAGCAVRVHVEVDTGMGRTGVDATEAVDFLAAVDALPALRVGSVFTHFPDADAQDLAYARQQVARFGEVLAALGERGLAPPLVHAANSAATLRLAESRLSLVRPGLAAYGVAPPHADTAGAGPDLRPAMSFRARLVQVRRVRAGRPVSYGRTFVTARDSVIGVVPVGYGHGYSWLCSNRGQMLVGGVRAPIVGRVTMDLTMLDLTDLAAAGRTPRPGDPVVLFGSRNGASIPIEELAAWSGTLPYEVLCTIGKRVTRVYLRGGRPWRVVTLVGELDPGGAPSILDEETV